MISSVVYRKLLGLSAFRCDERSCQRWAFHSPVVFIFSVFKKYSSRSVKMETLLPISPLSLAHSNPGASDRITWRPLVRWCSLQIYPKRVQNYCVLPGDLRLSRQIWSPLVPLPACIAALYVLFTGANICSDIFSSNRKTK